MKSFLAFIPPVMRNVFPFISSRQEQARVSRAFENTKSERERKTKLFLYTIMRHVMKKRRTSFGMLAVWGWKQNWFSDFASFPDSTQNMFAHTPYRLDTHTFDDIVSLFMQLSHFDGAILVNRRGALIASGVYLENMRPKEVARIINPRGADDLSGAFGFARKVHTRHLAGIACSYRLKGTTVYAISEEQRILRVFENGKIVFSTLSSEIVRE